jgi:hypothetical protein
MNKEIAREKVVFRAHPRTETATGLMSIHGSNTSLAYDVSIYASYDLASGRQHCTISIYNGIDKGDCWVYVANQNAFELLRSDAPLWIVLDAILEAPDEEWSGVRMSKLFIPKARQLLEQLAMMELVMEEFR